LTPKPAATHPAAFHPANPTNALASPVAAAFHALPVMTSMKLYLGYTQRLCDGRHNGNCRRYECSQRETTQNFSHELPPRVWMTELM